MLVLVVLGAIAWAAPAWGKPKADESARQACGNVRYINVNKQYGLEPGASDFQLLVAALDESKSKGAQRLADRLLDAPTSAAQLVYLDRIQRWCLNGLNINCNALAQCTKYRP